MCWRLSLPFKLPMPRHGHAAVDLLLVLAGATKPFWDSNFLGCASCLCS